MRTLHRPARPAVRRLWITAVTAAVAATVAAAPLATAAPATAPQHTTAAVTKAPQSFLFQYTFNHHLKIGGGNFTVGGLVYLAVKFNNGAIFFHTNVTAQTHPVTPGGAIYVETTVASPCAPGNNGYAQAYDWTTQTWSPKLPVPICVPID
ncbi:hypothetical protein SAMN04487983_1001243 [Streptomyces sp. yr375]|uniref:hypothetical protein n=1 Tax=Streptomyces sp. yr375 TaxID=1761906 RepID=UPI0008CB98E3|nr:hypothetical protein [Streptomyces sp. yr375]SEP67214.1 hypothetical protein SAMN04487983_1001243 [Streptomyces sp. yr375]